jgi:uncharacterized Zn finger protein
MTQKPNYCKCPFCKTKREHTIIRSDYDGNNNIHKMGSLHLKCNMCGYEFNKWLCSYEKLKEVFGEQYPEYKNNC